ncbi:MAG: Inner membrane protein YbaN [Dehalococcoidia bacterium]|nr:Inner membrane protein YbaN [Bacillota bacterium]MBT9143318.1 Inner membrane protein YbaN [Bacillota bacterium]
MRTLDLKKYMLMLLGLISLVVGIIGAFIPLLPTTPFLLLSSYCFLRSSRRLYNWLIHHRIFGNYIYNYLTYKAIPISTKIGSMITLWLTLMISMHLLPGIHLRLLLLIVGICVSIHVLTLKSI